MHCLAMIIRHLPYFAVAAEEENFQRAAGRLHISQPALSRRIQDLEAELGVLLFERVQGRVRLTEVGRILSIEAKRMILDVEGLTRRIREMAKGREVLRIAFNESALRHQKVTDAIKQFRLHNPMIELRLLPLSSAKSLAALRVGQISAGYMHINLEMNADISWIDIRDDDQYVAAVRNDHPLARRKALQITDLADVDMIWPSRDLTPALYDRLIEVWNLVGLEPHISVEVISTDSIFNAVSAGLGVGLVRLSQSGREPGDVKLIRIDDLKLALDFKLAWLSSNQSATLLRFLHFLTPRSP